MQRLVKKVRSMYAGREPGQDSVPRHLLMQQRGGGQVQANARCKAVAVAAAGTGTGTGAGADAGAGVGCAVPRCRSAHSRRRSDALTLLLRAARAHQGRGLSGCRAVSLAGEVWRA